MQPEGRSAIRNMKRSPIHLGASKPNGYADCHNATAQDGANV
jgi:hypothetical protein